MTFAQIAYIWVRNRTCLQTRTIYMIVIIGTSLDPGVYTLSSCEYPAISQIKNSVIY